MRGGVHADMHEGLQREGPHLQSRVHPRVRAVTGQGLESHRQRRVNLLTSSLRVGKKKWLSTTRDSIKSNICFFFFVFRTCLRNS